MIFSPFSSQNLQEQLKQQNNTSAVHANLPRPKEAVGGVGESVQEITPHRTLGYHGNLHQQSTAKSAAMPAKRNASSEPNGAPTKQIKTEHPEEFSNAVKKKLQSSSRTGQACDRCKVRQHHENMACALREIANKFADP